KGNVGFGNANTIITQSGSVNPDATSVSLFPTFSSGGADSLLLATGNSTFGRDGLREAMRLGASDISGSVPSFNPTSSSSGRSWNDIARPTSDASTYRADHFIVYRLSLQGNGIPTSGIGKNPVIVLRPGFQLSLDYQSPNGQWYPYSFLQGNNATNTWISA